METDTAFVGANSVVELYAIAYVVLYFALVVNPGDAESEDTVGLYHTFDQTCFLELGVLVVNLFY